MKRLFICIILAACTPSLPTSDVETSLKQVVAFQQVKFDIPANWKISQNRSDYWLMDNILGEYHEVDGAGEAQINIYAKNESCTPSLTGVSQEGRVNAVSWGKVDYWDLYAPMFDFPNMVEPLCRPPLKGVAYAMCSQKDGKTVVICLSQATDDPKQAEEIFSTFQWKE